MSCVIMLKSDHSLFSAPQWVGVGVSNLGPDLVCAEFACSSQSGVGFFGGLQFLPQSKHMCVR